MSLATVNQIINTLLNINNTSPLFRNHKILFLGTEENRLSGNYRNTRLFHHQPSANISFWPDNYELQNESKVISSTGKRNYHLQTDLFFHWMTKFDHLKTAKQLREAITNPETGASFATTIAVNKFIQSQEKITEHNIKQLFVGSKWRWIKLTNGDYVQQTLYSNEYSGPHGKLPLFIAACSSNTFSGMSVTSIIPFDTWLTIKINNLDQMIARTPRELMGYSTKATSHFSFKPSPKKLFHTFLGIELELENLSASEWKTLDILQNHAIFKRDGSVSSGVEICTTPATLDVHKEEFEKFFTGIKTNKSKFKDKENCGMHVHIDRAKLSTLHIANIYQFINNKENLNKISHIAGRQPNTFCKQHNIGYDHFTGNHQLSDRYLMVNLQPSETIEIRIFASTINYQDFCKRLEFVQAIVDYTRPGEVSIPVSKIPLWDHFENYIKTKRKIYPELVTSIYGKKPIYVPK